MTKKDLVELVYLDSRGGPPDDFLTEEEAEKEVEEAFADHLIEVDPQATIAADYGEFESRACEQGYDPDYDSFAAGYLKAHARLKGEL